MSTASPRNAVDGLVDAVSSPPTLNDLGRLARMHTFCQILANSPEPVQPAPRESLQELAAALGALLEKLILAEAARPEDGLALLPQAVALLAQLCAGQATDTAEVLARIQAAVEGTPLPQPAATSATPADGDRQTRPESRCHVAAPPAECPASRAAGPPPAAPDAAAPTDGEPPYVCEPLRLDLNEAEHLRGFIEESREHLDAIEAALLAVERDPTDTERINELFRPFHTIKGIAGFLNLRDINRLTHEVETILDLGRKNELTITSFMIDRIFAAVDLLKTQIAEIQQFMQDPQGQICPQPDVAGLIAQLRAIVRERTPLAGAAPSPPRPRLGDVLVAQGAATPGEVEEALALQTRMPPPAPRLGEILMEKGTVSYEQVDSALYAQATGKPVLEHTIRVETAKLDALVDAVGELVIAQTMVNLNRASQADPKLSRDVAQVTKIVRDVQGTAMGLRMVPIGATFQRMRRLVRDLARKAGKEVALHINGEDTELDKTVVQQIADPLVHMVRNAVDHGIEPPQERRQAGKPTGGNVYLDAYHQGESIVIEVCDDGRGLDPARLIAKARERGLVGPDEQLTDQQAYALIFQPGFSTATEVTDVSGRGVGMDVVRRNIDALRGQIEVQSEVGQGATFFIRLPLTLAIIDGMLVRVGRERLIIPTILIDQSLRPQPRQITTVQRRGEMLQVRGELCPLIQLGQLFGYGGRVDPCQTLVVVVHCQDQKIGLVVDELIGQQQVVIKSLAESFKRISGVSGAAILGDGRVGLILEPTGLLQLHNQRRDCAPATGRQVELQTAG